MVVPVQVALTLSAEAGVQSACAAVLASSTIPKAMTRDRAAFTNAGHAARLVKPRPDTMVAFNPVTSVTVVILDLSMRGCDQPPQIPDPTLKHSAPLRIIGTNEVDELRLLIAGIFWDPGTNRSIAFEPGPLIAGQRTCRAYFGTPELCQRRKKRCRM